MLRVLITGSSGMLGKDVFVRFSKAGFRVFGVDQVKSLLLPEESQIIGDITDNEFVSLVLKKVNPHIIIHCAAIVNLNACEENHDLAFSLHVEATKNLAQYKAGGTKVIYISTDSVFDGKKGNYAETDMPNPLNYYAKSKLEGENAAKLNPNYIVVRTNIFGFNIPLRNSLAEWAIKNFESSNNISGFDDVIFNAIYTKHLAGILVEAVNLDIKGTINIASGDYVSKYDFLQYMACKFKFAKEKIGKTLMKDLDFEITRPLNTTLNINKAKKYFSIPSIFEGIDQLYIDYTKTKENENN